jgi:hypothetical protein
MCHASATTIPAAVSQKEQTLYLLVLSSSSRLCCVHCALVHGVYFLQANYINALAVSVSPFFEPAEVTLGGLIFFPWVDFL